MGKENSQYWEIIVPMCRLFSLAFNINLRPWEFVRYKDKRMPGLYVYPSIHPEFDFLQPYYEVEFGCKMPDGSMVFGKDIENIKIGRISPEFVHHCVEPSIWLGTSPSMSKCFIFENHERRNRVLTSIENILQEVTDAQ